MRERAYERIKDHGGAARYWRHASGARSCLCRDGTQLILSLTGVRWRWMDRDDFLSQHGWQDDTRAVMRGAISRTTRQARRQD